MISNSRWLPFSAAFFLASLATLGACGGSAPPPQEPEVSEPEPVAEKEAPAKEKEAPPPKRKTAKELITAGSTFMFVLADSGPMEGHTKDCDKKAKGDDDKLAACLKKIEDVAAKEGIRFEQGEDESWWWVSFGEANGKPVVYNKVQFDIASDAETSITLTPKGKDMGKKPMKKLPAEITLESPDEKTLVMNDPAKGKLVYRAE